MSILQATHRTVRLAAAVLAASMALALSALDARAQQPSPAAMTLSKEIVGITGSTALFAPLISGVVEQAKLLFLQQNPALSKDLTEIANKMRADLAPRQEELNAEVARLHAVNFNEQELKDILAFYKSPAGKKLLTMQPSVVEGSMKYAQDWANRLSEEVIGKMREEMKKKGHTL